MKKILKFLGLAAIAVTLCCVTMCCTKASIPWLSDAEYVDSATVSSQIEGYINPQFTSTSAMLEFHAQDVKGYEIDSTFRAMPVEILTNVSNVLLNKSGVVCKKAVVEEYLANRQVYDNLKQPTSTNAAETNTDASDSGDKSTPSDEAFKTDISYRTDTIDGKPVKVQIKKEERYVNK